MLKTTIIILFISVFSTISSGQTDYSKFVKTGKKSKKQFVKTKDRDTENIIYLGDIKNKNGLTIYFVLSSFSVTQAAIQKHGHSNVIFLDSAKTFKKEYEIGLPEELPFKLQNNTLFFYYIDDNSKTKKYFKTKSVLNYLKFCVLLQTTVTNADNEKHCA